MAYDEGAAYIAGWGDDQIAARIILAPHLRLGMHETRDTGGDRIVFDAGEIACATQRLGQQSEE